MLLPELSDFLFSRKLPFVPLVPQESLAVGLGGGAPSTWI
jgi:hypothetical protein